MIRVTDMTVKFGEVVATNVPEFELGKADRVAVLGRNGSGKSTFLRVLAGLQAPTTGAVTGVPPRGEVTLVHQAPYLYRGSALDNVEYALKLRGRDRSTARDWLARLGATAFADREAKRLSGGERRRVALARAFASGPSVLLLDEPLSALDDAGSQHVREAIAGFEGALVVASPDDAILDLVDDLRRVDLSPST